MLDIATMLFLIGQHMLAHKVLLDVFISDSGQPTCLGEQLGLRLLQHNIFLLQV